MRKFAIASAVVFAAVALWSTLAIALSPYNAAVVLQSGELLAAAISGATGGGPATVLTPTKDCAALYFENTSNVEVSVTLAGTKIKRVPSGTSRALNLAQDGARVSKASTVGVYPSGGTGPSSGAFEAICTPAY